MMRILIFNWRDPRHSWAGGGEVYIFEQASRWVKMGHEVTVFCGEDKEKNLPSFEKIQGIKIYRKGGRYSLYLWAIWYYMAHFRGKTDIVIDVENGIPFFTPIFCRIPKIAYVYHIHGNQFFYELPAPINLIGYTVEKFIFPFLYRDIPIIVISKTTKNQLIKMGFHAEKITIVYCGINGSKIVKNSIKKFSHPTVLYLGRIKKYKRVDLLIKIFSRIVEKVPQARLVIAGWGTEALNIADLVMRNDLRRKILLRGPVTDKEKKVLLSKSWVFVNPSIAEGWSIAVIEANFHRTPAISFKVPGLIESIKSGKTGLLAKDEKDLVEKICLVLTNQDLREKLSKNAKIWATNFSWDRSAKESLSILEKIRRGK